MSLIGLIIWPHEKLFAALGNLQHALIRSQLDDLRNTVNDLGQAIAFGPRSGSSADAPMRLGRNHRLARCVRAWARFPRTDNLRAGVSGSPFLFMLRNMPLAHSSKVSHRHFVISFFSNARTFFIPSNKLSSSASFLWESVRQRSEARVESRKPKNNCRISVQCKAKLARSVNDRESVEDCRIITPLPTHSLRWWKQSNLFVIPNPEG
jgi:hypothetical protein